MERAVLVEVIMSIWYQQTEEAEPGLLAVKVPTLAAV
jgi:hypothetical protein